MLDDGKTEENLTAGDFPAVHIYTKHSDGNVLDAVYTHPDGDRTTYVQYVTDPDDGDSVMMSESIVQLIESLGYTECDEVNSEEIFVEED